MRIFIFAIFIIMPILSGLGKTGASNTSPCPKKVDVCPEPSCAIARTSIFLSEGMVTMKSYVSAIAMNVLLWFTGITSSPSAEINKGSSPPNVSQN